MYTPKRSVLTALKTWVVVAIALFGSLPSPALAWWNYAKWGITEAQLVEASHGMVKPCSEMPKGRCTEIKEAPELAPRLFVRTPIIGEEVYVQFYFDTAGFLKRTEMSFWRTDFQTISETLTGTYGPPFQSKKGEFANGIWRDAGKGTLIKAQNVIGSVVFVTYEPIRGGL